MSFFSKVIVQAAGSGAYRRLVENAKDPAGSQLRLLRSICERNADTEYGKQNRFGDVRSFEDWRKSVPVVTYERLRPRIDRMAKGEKNVLTAEPPLMFAQTSGTTGDPKLVPVTKTCRSRIHSDQMRAWLYRALADHPTFLDGRIVSFVSKAVEGQTEGGIPYGSTSGHIYTSMSRPVKAAYAVPYEAFEIGDYEAQYYAILRIAMQHDVTFLATANPSTLAKMCDTAEREADALIRDLRDGTMREDLEIDAGIRSSLAVYCRKEPEKARRLDEARAKRGGKLLPADIWPNVALLGCWKGGTVGAYLKPLAESFDPDGSRPVAVRDWGYLSSEARCSVPLRDDGESGVLSVGSNVYEFVAAEELEERPDDWASWRFLGVDEIEKGREYYVMLTTTGGLYRYDINDVIEMTGTFEDGSTPEIAFRRKGRGVTSITGEKVTVNQVVEAFEKAGAEIGVRVDYFKAEADVEEKRYVFKVESKESLGEDRSARLLGALDKNLRALNIEYESKRKSQRLGPPVLRVMKSGWYDDRRRELADAGKNVFQAKTVVLATRDSSEPNDREKEFVETEVTLQHEMA